MKDTFVPMLAASVVFMLATSTAGAQPRSIYQQGKHGTRIATNTSSTGPGIDASVPAGMVRRVWLRTE